MYKIWEAHKDKIEKHSRAGTLLRAREFNHIYITLRQQLTEIASSLNESPEDRAVAQNALLLSTGEPFEGEEEVDEYDLYSSDEDEDYDSDEDEEEDEYDENNHPQEEEPQENNNPHGELEDEEEDEDNEEEDEYYEENLNEDEIDFDEDDYSDYEEDDEEEE